MTNIPKVNVNVDIDGNKIYDDNIKPITSPAAETLGLIPRAIHAAFVPLEKWILNKEFNLAETQKLLEQKLQNVAPENIVPPEPYVAIPAMQALSYSISNDNLRDMYASLLAKAMCDQTKEKVHPSFVDSIRQMSPVDAQLFKEIGKTPILPLVQLRETLSDGFNLLETNISGFDIAEHDILSASIDNLVRLKLIEVPADEHLVNDRNYQIIFNSSEYRKLFNKHNATKFNKVEPHKQLIRVTSLGKLFYRICVNDSFYVR